MIFQPVDGGLRLAIDDHSREVIAHLLGELCNEVEVAKTTAPAQLAPHMKRLFPTAYHNDEQHNNEYRRLTHGDLADTHLAALNDAVLLLTPGRVFVEGDLERFVRAINAMRLVLGTVLDVSEDDTDGTSDDTSDDVPDSNDPVALQREVYQYLGWLLHTSLDQLRM